MGEMIDKFKTKLVSEICGELQIQNQGVKGRGLFTANEIPKDTLIFKEAPFVVGPSLSEMDVSTSALCITCAAVIRSFDAVCSNCGVDMCRSCSHVFEEECSLLLNHLQAKKCQQVSNWIAVLRMALKTKTAWMELEDHMDQNPRMDFYKCNILGQLRELCPSVHENDILKIAAILDSNSFRINKHGLRGLFTLSSFINHDCTPNARVIFDNKGHLHLLAKKKILPGEEICISYVPSLLSTRERRQKLMDSKFFLCECARCMDPTELGSHLSSLVCPKCDSGHVVKKEDSWGCLNCPFKTPDDKVKHLLEALSQRLLRSASDLPSLLKTLDEASFRLHPHHSLILEHKRRILECSRGITLKSLDLRLSVLSQRMKVLEILEGDMDSRLKGFLSFQTLELLMGKLYVLSKNNEENRTQELKGLIGENMAVALRILRNDNNCPPDLLKFSAAS